MAETDVERILAEEMATYEIPGRDMRQEPFVGVPDADATEWNVPDVTLRRWPPVGAYPSDYGRNPPLQDVGPEWDFRPCDERLD
ncbi:MAG: hypothetical protein EON60_11955 [Alphaproteobacteria bacterium]|nr:MAG: hypothetical protein EON60_11955 [Alphaproteobacteria bacterium]